MRDKVNYHFEDFTETEYRKLLRMAKANWELISFADYQKPGKVCIWRHDIDCSVHRAYRLALIESEEGIKATYFIHLHSIFYNVFEDAIVERIARIKGLGHIIGLHFDPQFYVNSCIKQYDILQWLKFERDILQQIFEIKLSAFSIHDPNFENWDGIETDEIAGMVNVYGPYIRKNYHYCSDSNGYWRFQRLRNLLEAADKENLHILTHPGMWTPEPMSPRKRITRCIEGRAANNHKMYDDTLTRLGRTNVN